MLQTLDPPMASQTVGPDTYPLFKMKRLSRHEKVLFPGNTAPVEPWMTTTHILDSVNGNFDVVREKLRSETFDRTYPGLIHWHRGDNGDHLGLHGPKRDVVQPARFIENFKACCDASRGNLHLDLVGMQEGGKSFFMASRITDNIDHVMQGDLGLAIADRHSPSYIEKADRTNCYFILRDFYAEKKAPRAYLWTNELACDNGMAHKLEVPVASLSHLRKQSDEEIRHAINAAMATAIEYLKTKNLMIEKKITKDSALSALENFYVNELGMESDCTQLKTVQNIYENNLKGGDLETRQGNVWRVMNAITQYSNHGDGHRKHSEETRFRSLLDGHFYSFNKKFSDFAVSHLL